MNARRILHVAALATVVGCVGDKSPTGVSPGAPSGPSEIISDGAHGGNKDFWFLPPMVPLPVRNADFEVGKFNNTLRPSLKVEICELNSDNLKAGGLPTELTTCGAIKKTFAPGTVNLVNLPLRQNGWWSVFGLPPDGFYYVLWDTRQSNLNVSKYYRIKVFIDGNSTPLGVADVDPMANLFQWKYSLTGDVIQLVDDVMLPITFRVEKGGGSTLCGGAAACSSATITANSTTPQAITVEGGGGSIAGASFPNGWLPPGGPQSVVVTIAEVNTAGGGSTNDNAPCHVGLALQQFRGCFRFTTTPALQTINERGDEFAQPVTVAVCYELDGTGDPREKFAELWSSGPNEPPHPLDDASDAGLLGAAARNCSRGQVIGALDPNPLVRLASAGWSRVKGGLGRLFGVKTAYAVDLGLGGFSFAFSQVSPVLTADIQAYTSTTLTNLGAGAATTSTVRIVGNNHHNSHAHTTGLGGLPVTFTLAAGNGSLLPLGGEGAGANQVTVTTNTNPIDGGPTSGGGFAPVNWTMPTPTQPGTYVYTLTANGPALGGPVTFTSTVTVVPQAPPPDLIFSATIPPTLQSSTASATNGTVTIGAWRIQNAGGTYPFNGTINHGVYLSTDPTITTNDTFLGVEQNSAELDVSNSTWINGIHTFDLPQNLTPGIYYVGIILDRDNVFPESTAGENNNTFVLPVVVVGPDLTNVFLAGNEIRMLSMQTGATWRATVTPSFAPRTTFSWTSPDENNVSISAGIGYVDVHAIVGGENISQDAEAHVTGFYTDPATGGTNPGTDLLINSFSFNHFPRTTSLAWNAVPGAVAYHVVTEFGNGSDPSPPFCSVPATCTTWTVQPTGSAYTTALTHLFDFVGSQPGRWRVFAIGADGTVINTSPYVYFDYDV